ncbi:L,D-transpeptidase family protein [Patescibacteria group bacterium]|nr:L,D-transpeptidase family protein [Patescibacteria group bacterium]MBU2219412.1 L,D-transpeptidase family protein [Patescibacteria group bacterium]MBU2263624.1 L,D-transpeptidase family protein [Patescibacteria group bacterium]
MKYEINIKNSKYFIAIIGTGMKNFQANLYFLQNKNGVFELIKKNHCFVGINGWGMRSDLDKRNMDLTELNGYKKEGDGKTPEGLFMLGRMFSHDLDKKIIDGKESGNNPNLYCYEKFNDVYECCIPDSPVGDKRNESERMTNPLYRRAIFINYNYPVKNPRAGSCIFLHIGDKATAGCVAVDFQMIDEIFQLITPNTTLILMISNKENLRNFPEADFLTQFI